MIKEIITDQSQLLESKVWDVRGNQDVSISLVQDLEDTLCSLDDRIFLCSNEIGYKERAIDIKFVDDTLILMNPAFQKRNNLKLVRETDVETGVDYFIPRFTEVEVIYQDCLGSIKANKLNEQASIVFCQAMDRLNGLKTSDYGLEILPEFDNASEDEKADVIKLYMDKLLSLNEKLDNDLLTSDDTKDIWNAAKYIQAVADGDVSLEHDEVHQSNRKKKKLQKLLKSIKEQKNKLKYWGKK